MNVEYVIESPVGNYYGNVAVKASDGKFWMGVENYTGDHGWVEISERLFDAFVEDFGPKEETE